MAAGSKPKAPLVGGREMGRVLITGASAGIGAELARILPGAELLRDWKGPGHLDAQRRTVVAFLAKHTPRQNE